MNSCLEWVWGSLGRRGSDISMPWVQDGFKVWVLLWKGLLIKGRASAFWF